mgnify:FL=1
MKNEKLKLRKLKIQSFVTNELDETTVTIKGGTGSYFTRNNQCTRPTIPYCPVSPYPTHPDNCPY